jgi:hypothetical protein
MPPAMMTDSLRKKARLKPKVKFAQNWIRFRPQRILTQKDKQNVGIFNLTFLPRSKAQDSVRHQYRQITSFYLPNAWNSPMTDIHLVAKVRGRM